MKPTTIFFDKDGTLMEFDPFWVSISRHAMRDIIQKYKSGEEAERDTDAILSSMGVSEGKTDVNAVLCKGTYAEMAEIVREYLAESGYDTDVKTLESDIIRAYQDHMDKGKVIPTCDNLREVLTAFRDQGIRLCVVTTDHAELTKQCLKKLNIIDLFQRIYTDDGSMPAKPNPACIEKYCAETGIEKNKIVMVGDTATDIRFAKNAGIAVICVGEEENRKTLEADADASVADLSQLHRAIEVL